MTERNSDLETTDDLYGPQPWFARGNRIKDNHGFEVCFMSCDPAYVLNEREKRQRNLITAAPLLLEACKRIDAAPYGVAIGDFEFLQNAIREAESV